MRSSKRSKKPSGSRKDSPSRDSAPELDQSFVSPLLDSPHAILDEALADAARTVALAAQGGEISREQLAAAQDILNRKGITNASKTSAIPEAFAREAFSAAFRLFGFPPIKWPRASVEKAKSTEPSLTDEFNRALADV